MKLFLSFEDMIEVPNFNLGGLTCRYEVGDIDGLTTDEIMELVRVELEKARGVYVKPTL